MTRPPQRDSSRSCCSSEFSPALCIAIPQRSLPAGHHAFAPTARLTERSQAVDWLPSRYPPEPVSAGHSRTGYHHTRPEPGSRN